MAGSRAEKSTIPQDRDPLANVTYRPQVPPINDLIANTTQEAKPEPEGVKQPEPKREPKPEEAEPPKGKVTVLVPMDLLERLRNAAYWKRKTLATLAEEGIRLVVERLERENRGPFEPREDELKTGRPQGSKNYTPKRR
jgi:hypothetical protein